MTSPLSKTDPRGPRDTARAIIMRQAGKATELLVIERWRKADDGQRLHYFSIPGGGIEPGETKEQAVIREVREETQLEVALGSLVAAVRLPGGVTHYYFNCRYESGEPALAPDSQEALESSVDNRFEPVWRPLVQIRSQLHPAYQKLLPLLQTIADGKAVPVPWQIDADGV